MFYQHSKYFGVFAFYYVYFYILKSTAAVDVSGWEVILCEKLLQRI